MSKAPKVEKKRVASSTKAELVINVNAVKRGIKNYASSQGIVEPVVSGGDIALAALLESFIKLMVNECAKTVGLSKSNLREITREAINNTIMGNEQLKLAICVKTFQYDESQLYDSQVPIMKKEFDEIVTRINPAVSFTAEGRNYTVYLLMKVYSETIINCGHLLEFAKKKTVDGRSVLTAIKMAYPCSKHIAMQLSEDVNRAMKLSGKNLESTNEEEEEAEEEEEEVKEEIKVVTPVKGGKRGSKVKQLDEDKTEEVQEPEPEPEPVVEKKVSKKNSRPAKK